MKRTLLHAFVCLAVLFAFAGCEVVTKKSGERAQFTTPQTGSNIGRRVSARSTSRQTQTTRRSTARQQKREQAKSEREKKKDKKRETVDDDFMPRGGFR